MIWNDHSKFNGLHAFLSPSQHSWVNYSKEKLEITFERAKAKEHGTKIHGIAKELIDERIELPKIDKTLNLYVNDGIGYEMSTEILLYYSDYCFGTADAISFRGKKLRIHDLKTGEIPASMMQLEIYAALFCLEYKKEPQSLEIELRIYQDNHVVVEEPDAVDIKKLMEVIIESDKTLQILKKGV